MKTVNMYIVTIAGMVLLILAFFSFNGLLYEGTLTVHSHNSTSSSPLEVKGHELRAAINAAYKELDNSNKIKPIGNGRNDITYAVDKYLISGMDFIEAEKLVVAAGFSIKPRSVNIQTREPQELTEIDKYRTSIFGKTSLIIVIYPSNPDDWSTLGRATASVVRIFI